MNLDDVHCTPEQALVALLEQTLGLARAAALKAEMLEQAAQRFEEAAL